MKLSDDRIKAVLWWWGFKAELTLSRSEVAALCREVLAARTMRDDMQAVTSRTKLGAYAAHADSVAEYDRVREGND